MKRIITLLTLSLLVISFSNPIQAQSTQEAIVYMNDLTEPIAGLKKETWKYLKAVTKGKGARLVENKRKKLVKETKLALVDTKKKKAFNGNDSLKIAIVNYLSLSYSVLNDDFEKIVDMEEIAEQSYDAMEAYIMAKEQANDKLSEASEKMSAAQEEFAVRYDIRLLDNDDKTVKKIEKAGKALKYYNQVYLIFFKVYKQEMYVIEAMQNADVNALQQNISALSSLADEGLEKLKGLEAFEGDQSLIKVTRDLLNFYKREATKDLPTMVDFFIKKDNFEKIKKTVESKSKSQRTQKDLDQYNKAAGEYNKAVNAFNKSNEMVNKQRQRFLDIFNSKVNAFFERHA